MLWLQEWWNNATAASGWLVVFGLLGQGMFAARFLVQWISSERAGRSVVPLSFWYFSMAGALMVMTYGFLKPDLVVLAGQLPSLLIYSRNIYFLRREERRQRAEAPV
jgi:lipid-A-disaccharide synthase-like uncharacterized protein